MVKRMCDFEGCDRPPRRGGRGLCDTHYAQRRRYGKLKPIRPALRGSYYDRVMGRIKPVGDCIEFTGGLDIGGYGKVGGSNGCFKAHRVVWEHHNGPIPDGLVIRHTCDNPPCVNIEHLLIGTHVDNYADMVERGRRRRANVQGSRNPRAKLTEADVRAIRADPREHAVIAAEYPIDKSGISGIKLRKTWKHVE